MIKVKLMSLSDSENVQARSSVHLYDELTSAQKALESLSFDYYRHDTRVTIYETSERALDKKLYSFELNNRNVNLLKLDAECKLAHARVREIENKRYAYQSSNDLSAHRLLLKSAIKRVKDLVFNAHDLNVQSIRA